MIIQATTPTHTFNIPFDVISLEKVQITYGQNGAQKFSKTKEECSCSGKSIKVTLTQEETLQFDPNFPVQIQVRALTTGGDAIASRIKLASVDPVLNGDVL